MASIKDVAKRAGVSISTVSNVLNKSKYVSDELKIRVNVAVQELGYQANPIAQNMKFKNTKTVGIITADLCGLFYPYVLKGMYEIFYKKGYQVIILDSDGLNDRLGSIKKLREGIHRLILNRVDGIVFASTVPESLEKGIAEDIKRMASNYKNKKIGLVCVETDLSGYGIDSVFSNSVIGAEKATSHLIDMGCKRIGHITGPIFTSVAQDRLRGYKNILSKHGHAFHEAMIAEGNYTHKSGYSAMKELLQKTPDIDGVFVANDQMSVGALKALSEAGKRVPQDIKMVGYDDVFIASVLEPPLSTIHIRKNYMGSKAAELLIEQIEENKESRKPAAIELESRLVVRKSTSIQAPEDWILVDW